jgi:hypothetical protein
MVDAMVVDETLASIPDAIRRDLSDVYTDEGVVMWWRARNRMLGRERPCDLAADGRIDDVARIAAMLAGGNF